ncbi:hypothetical protein E6C60_0852 [Paenibacillus algicola]|uniref:Uncharacterized protein n=1 Tax=Paenibacillus algicola TaxID=2565926 RepID=A0A4P8XHD0_9BACL|nr:hypothetical protein E6C60_0852 [Paenibacillus algicola]
MNGINNIKYSNHFIYHDRSSFSMVSYHQFEIYGGILIVILPS